MPIFMFSRGNAILILKTVVVTEDAQVNIAALDLFQIDLIGATIHGWEFFKQKNFGDETAQHCITEQKGFQVEALLRKLLLHAADKNSESSHC